MTFSLSVHLTLAWLAAWLSCSSQSGPPPCRICSRSQTRLMKAHSVQVTTKQPWKQSDAKFSLLEITMLSLDGVGIPAHKASGWQKVLGTVQSQFLCAMYNTLTDTHPPTYTVTHPQTHTHQHTQWHTHRHTHTNIHSETPTDTHTPTYTVTHPQTPTHQHTQWHTHRHTPTNIHSDTPADVPTQTRTNPHTCTQLHTPTHPQTRTPPPPTPPPILTDMHPPTNIHTHTKHRHAPIRRHAFTQTCTYPHPPTGTHPPTYTHPQTCTHPHPPINMHPPTDMYPHTQSWVQCFHSTHNWPNSNGLPIQALSVKQWLTVREKEMITQTGEKRSKRAWGDNVTEQQRTWRACPAAASTKSWLNRWRGICRFDLQKHKQAGQAKGYHHRAVRQTEENRSWETSSSSSLAKATRRQWDRQTVPVEMRRTIYSHNKFTSM